MNCLSHALYKNPLYFRCSFEGDKTEKFIKKINYNNWSNVFRENEEIKMKKIKRFLDEKLDMKFFCEHLNYTDAIY